MTENKAGWAGSRPRKLVCVMAQPSREVTLLV